MTDIYTAEVCEGLDGELYIKFPDDLIKDLGWDETTKLIWDVTEEKTTLRKVVDDEEV
jgi:hypothetical protein